MGGGANSSKEPEKTPKQLAREQVRQVERSKRKIDREIQKLEGNEKKALKEVEKLAK